MDIRPNNTSFFVFDLDDTLYPEIDFLKSGYKAIANYLYPKIGVDIYQTIFDLYKNGNNAFQWIVDSYSRTITMENLIQIYREHVPSITINKDAKSFLNSLKERNIPLGIITDGRSITQRNKLKSLGISDLFVDIIISEEFGSEKPNPKNYTFFEDKYPQSDFYFFGDNTKKDFLTPIQLGWTCFCIKDKGYNIHKQTANKLSLIYIDSFNDISLI